MTMVMRRTSIAHYLAPYGTFRGPGLLLSASEGPWIVNIDLDYFFYQTEESYELMVSESYLRSVAEGLRKAMQIGSVGAVVFRSSRIVYRGIFSHYLVGGFAGMVADCGKDAARGDSFDPVTILAV